MLLTVAVLTVTCAAGCSTQPAPDTRPGTLLIGTARITVNGADLGLTDQVSCTVDGPLTTVATGTGQSGITAVLSTANSLHAESVTIRNVGGFTGSYHAGSGDAPATVTMTGRSYDITGTADGFTVSQPAIQTSGTFTIDVAC